MGAGVFGWARGARTVAVVATLAGALAIGPAAAGAVIVVPHVVKPQTVTPQAVGTPPPPVQSVGSGPPEPIQNRAPTAPPAPEPVQPAPPQRYPAPKEADMPGFDRGLSLDFPFDLPDYRDPACSSTCKGVWQSWFDRQAYRIARDAEVNEEEIPLGAVSLLVWAQAAQAQVRAIDDWLRADPSKRGPPPPGALATVEEMDPFPKPSAMRKLVDDIADLAKGVVDFLFSDSDQSACAQPLPGEAGNSSCQK